MILALAEAEQEGATQGLLHWQVGNRNHDARAASAVAAGGRGSPAGPLRLGVTVRVTVLRVGLGESESDCGTQALAGGCPTVCQWPGQSRSRHGRSPRAKCQDSPAE